MAFSKFSSVIPAFPMFSLLDLTNAYHEAQAIKASKHDETVAVCDNKSLKCVVCSKKFNSKAYLKLHMYIHTGETPFKCHLCPSAFNRNDKLVRHMFIHADENPFICNLCPFTFSSYDLLTAHSSKVHGAKLSTSSFLERARGFGGEITGGEAIKQPLMKSMLDVSSRSSSPLQFFQTSNCSQGSARQMSRYNGQEAYNLTKIHANKETEVVPLDYFDVRGRDKDVGTSEKLKHKKRECAICGEDSFRDFKSLRNHYHIHKRRFICRFCGIEVSSAGNLSRHNLTHTGVKPFKCMDCNASFTRKESLQTHTMSVKKSCSKSIKIVRSFACKECPATFTLKSNLKLHLQKCHGKNSTKQTTKETEIQTISILNSGNGLSNGYFSCQICNKTFNTRLKFNCHIYSHEI